MDNQKGKGYAAERIWRLPQAAGQGFHRAVGGDTNREGMWSEGEDWKAHW